MVYKNDTNPTVVQDSREADLQRLSEGEDRLHLILRPDLFHQYGF